MEVALLVVIRYYAAGEYILTSQTIKFLNSESAQVAADDIKSALTTAGYTVTTKILRGAA